MTHFSEFVTSEPLDLSNCDREPIHIPGKIQSYGYLLVLREPELTILQASCNSQQLLGSEARSAIGQPLDRVLPKSEVKKLSDPSPNRNQKSCLWSKSASAIELPSKNSRSVCTAMTKF